MKSERLISERFVDAVHRRMIIFNSIEQAGRSLFVASMLAIVLILIATWQSMSTLPVLWLAAIFATIATAVCSLVRWPSRGAAAAEADRQLRLDDLLSTVDFYADSNDDFARAMLSMANARVAAHSPSDVSFRRLGIGYWSAIGAAICSAAMLAVIPFGSSRSQAVDANSAVLLTTSNDLSATNPSSAGNSPIAVNNDPLSQENSNLLSSSDPLVDQKSNGKEGHGNGKSNDKSGIGGGASTTAAKTVGPIRSDETAGQVSDANGSVGGGGAASNDAVNGHEANAQSVQTVVGPPHKNASVPALSVSSDGSGDSVSLNGNSSLNQSDRASPVHRDLVRDFFSGN